MASDPTLLQMQLRRNNEELQEALKSLDNWENEIKNRDDLLKKQKPILKKTLPPVRGKSHDSRKVVGKSSKNGDKEKPKRIKSYDYSGWNKFDVEAACKDVEADMPSSSSEEEDEEEGIKEEETRKETAILEKERGNQLYKEGKYEAAVERYTEAINLDPTSAVISANRAMALLKLGRYAAAEADCDVAITLDESYIKAWLRRGVARMRLNKLGPAKKDLQEVLKLDPANKQAKLELEKLDKVKVTEEDSNVKGRVYPIKIPPHLRSKKPFVRVKVEEISNSSNEDLLQGKESQQEELVLTEQLEPLHKEIDVTLPAVPETSIQFQRDWKQLCTHQTKLATYFKSIVPSLYPQVLRQSLESNTFSQIIKILENEYIKNGQSCIEELEWMTKVERFSVAVMFLGKDDKESLRRIFKSLCDICERNSVISLAKKFSIAL